MTLGFVDLDSGNGVKYDRSMIIDETNIPRYALFRGRKVRITGYDPANGNIPAKFWIVDTDDTQRSVLRGQLTFMPEMKPPSHEYPYGEGNQGSGTGPMGERLI